MHRSLLIPVLLAFLNCRRSEARPAPQADAAPCPTTVFLPEATLTANPGPSNAVINGLLDGTTSTIEANGPAISIGPHVLLLNDQLNLVLDGNQYEFSDVCPAMLIPITTPGAIASGEPEPSPTTIVPVVPGPTGTPGEEENNDNNDDNNNNNDDNNNDDNNNDDNNNDDNNNDDNNNDDNNNDDNNNDDNNNDDNNNNNDGTSVIPVVPVITAPPVVGPNDPNNDNPEECETKTASVCTQGCSFGVNDLGVTTTSSCKDPTCTATTGCTVSDTTSTTTIEPPSCSLAGNGVAAQYPFAIGDDGPLPTLLKPEAGAPTQVDPQPTNPPEPTQPNTEQPVATAQPVKPPTQIYEVGSYLNNEGKGIWAIFRHDKGGKVNVCGDNADKPMFEGPDLPAPEVLLNLVDAVKLGGFDLPDSYPACNFEANDPQQDGVILCNAQPEIKCKRTGQNSIGSCLVGSASFQALWICNE